MLEELKVIMETLGTATGAAKQFGLFWLGIELIKTIFAYALGGAVILVAWKLVSKVVISIQEQSFVRSLRYLVRTDMAYGAITIEEKTEILSVIKKGLISLEEEKTK